jgi:hypothetical protein
MAWTWQWLLGPDTEGLSNKGKNRKSYIFKIEKLVHRRRYQEGKRMAHQTGKVFANYICNVNLVFTVYKEFLQSSNKNASSILKWKKKIE